MNMNLGLDDVTSGVKEGVYSFLRNNSGEVLEAIVKGVAEGTAAHLKGFFFVGDVFRRTVEKGIANGVASYLKSINWSPERK